MKKKTSATEEVMGSLHSQMAAYFNKRLDEANNGGPLLSPAELKEMREFLKDSHIEASSDEANMVELAEDLPFAFYPGVVDKKSSRLASA